MNQFEQALPREALLIEAEKMFDGHCEEPLLDQALLVKDGQIVAMGKEAFANSAGAKRIQTPVLAPGFIDMQINGANGILFNASPDLKSIHLLMEGARRGGTAYALPTFITAEDQRYIQALQVSEQAAQEVPGVLGVHLEGPFLNDSRAGIHQRVAIRSMTAMDLDSLCKSYRGKRIITLAPERVDHSFISALNEAGWIILAGHTEATWKDIEVAQRAGLKGCTHLFNAMPPLKGREPGVVGAMLGPGKLASTVIADGIHVHRANLQLALQSLGDLRLCLVSDAMPTLGSDKTEFELDGRQITLHGNTLKDAAGTLAGAHLPMDQAVRNMVHFGGANQASALRMAASAPAHLLGLAHELGYLACGYRAGLTLLSEDLQAQAVVADGHFFSCNS